jgi:hypothetical protein
MPAMHKLPVVPICRSYDFRKYTILAAFHPIEGRVAIATKRGMERDGR